MIRKKEPTKSQTLSPDSLRDLQRDGKEIELIDVRTPVEYREMHLPFARNVPLDQLDPAAVFAARKDNDAPLYVICRSGSRGEKACKKFRDAGFDSVVNVDGGTLACEKAGLPLTRGKKAMSLERQVRIAAGTLVLIGVALGLMDRSAWFGLSAFVGAGLVFAGVTDTCGMGMLLSKMPWNRCDSPSESGEACQTGGASHA